MTRLEDWQQRLAAHLMATRRAPFKAGVHDCATWAAGAVLAMTGEDLAAGWRETYATEDAGFEALRAAGYEDHVAFAASLLPEVAPHEARPGDVVAVTTDGGPALGVVQGAHVYVAGAVGVRLVPRAQVTRAFRVGD